MAFVLCDPEDAEATVLAVGVTLPDGGAVTVDWRNGRAGTVGVWSSAEAAASVHQARLRWTTAHAPIGPPNRGLWRSPAASRGRV